jgi:hypothetical protein
MFTIKNGHLFAILLFFACNQIDAQVLITQNQMNYTQSFDGLPNNNNTGWANNATIPNWYAARTDYPNANSFPMRATNGSYGGPHLCNFRINAPGTNRALGSLGANGVHFAWGVRFRNETGEPIQSLTVSYWLEQWRKTSSANAQPLRFSYKISNAPITQIQAHEEGYSKVPFLNAISPVYTPGANAELNGDISANRVFVRHTLKINLQPGEEIMLKWYDEDDSKIDHGLAIDDLEVQFSVDAPALDVCNGDVPFAHLMKSIILDIPDEDSGIEYIVPTVDQQIVWEEGVEFLMAGDYHAAASIFDSMEIGYRVSAFVNGQDTLMILTKDGTSENYWGTYVFNPGVQEQCLMLQAPHPLNDEMTGEQATWLFEALEAYGLMIAGAHRCLSSEPSGCAGHSTVCRQDGQYVISDQAHTLQSVFQTTTATLATHFPESRFVQLHGFSKDENDPHFIISNGTRQTPDADYVAELGNYLESVPVNDIVPQPAGPLSYEAPHLNLNYNKLIGSSNTQGRYLNEYNKGDICTGGLVSTNVTGRFLHLEQYNDMRTQPANYPILRDALIASGIVSCNPPLGMSLSGAQNQVTKPTNLALELLYPSGSSSDIFCRIETTSEHVELFLYSLTGQKINQWSLHGGHAEPFRINVGSLPFGMYFLTARSGLERQTVKFIR